MVSHLWENSFQSPSPLQMRKMEAGRGDTSDPRPVMETAEPHLPPLVLSPAGVRTISSTSSLHPCLFKSSPSCSSSDGWTRHVRPLLAPAIVVRTLMSSAGLQGSSWVTLPLLYCRTRKWCSPNNCWCHSLESSRQ